jgi:hypothetical protein
MEEQKTAPELITHQEKKPDLELEVESKHIVICKVLLASELKKKKKTNRYVVSNKKSHDVLAEIYWNVRQYCFYPEPQCVWSTSCLDTVVEFIKQLNTGW